MTTRIALDLDNTIFDTTSVYRALIESCNCKYRPLVSYNPHENGYPTEVVQALENLFYSDDLCSAGVIDARIPAVLNALSQNPQYELFYITERDQSQHMPSYNQLKRAGILFEDSHLIHSKPKLTALREHKIDLCFDDAPHVVSDCIANDIDVVMISNYDTAYNHHLRESVENYQNLITALQKRGIIK